MAKNKKKRNANKAREAKQKIQKRQTQGNNQSGQIEDQPIEETILESSSSPKRKTDPKQILAKQIRELFDLLPPDLQKTETKQSCIYTIIDRNNGKCGDRGDFFGWLMKRAWEIRRTWDFKSECEKAGLSTEEEQIAVSEHLALEPKAIITKIRLDGLITYDGNIKMFRDRLIPEEYRYDKKPEKEKDKKVAVEPAEAKA